MRVRRLVMPLILVALATGCTAPDSRVPASTSTPPTIGSPTATLSPSLSRSLSPSLPPSLSPPAAANGAAALTAAEILAKAKAALTAAGSFRLAGSRPLGAVELTYRGANCRGKISVDGQPVEVIQAGSYLYLRAGNAFWYHHVAGEYLRLLDDKFGKVSDRDPDFSGFVPSIDNLLAPEGTLAKGSPTTVNGQAVIAVKTANASVFVATTGQPYPVRVDGKDGSAFDFSDFGAAVTIEAPPANVTVDLTHT